MLLKENMSTKKYYMISATIFLLYGMTVAAATFLINYNMQFKSVSKDLRASFSLEQSRIRKATRVFLGNSEEYLRALSSSEFVQTFLDDRSEKNRQTLNEHFRTFALSNANIMQLRLLGVDGMELVRINRTWGTPEVSMMAQHDLQDKSNRYYFTEVAKLRSGEFWYSALDLNMEKGEIEKPIKPTLRIATPLYNQGKFQGILIVNLHIARFLDSLGSSSLFHIYLIDKEGEFIWHPENQKSWSRYLPERPNLTREFPALAERVLNNTTIRSDELFGFVLAEQLPNRDHLKVFLIPRESLVKELYSANRTSASIVAGIVLLISVPLAWLIALIPARMQEKINEVTDKLYEYHKIVDRNIYTSTTDENGRITNVSSAFCDVTQFSATELIGASHKVIRHPDTADVLYQDMWEQLSQGRQWMGELQNRKKNGEAFWQHLIITPQFDGRGHISGYTGVGTDVTDKKEVERVSKMDRLTGLYNRHHLDEILQSEMDRFFRYNTSFSLILFDIDRFKQVNDTFGHQVGDDVLVQMAEILQKGVRKVDTAGRWGGEEFIVICPSAAQNQAAQLAEKLRKEIEATDFPLVGTVTSSFGVSEIGQNETVDVLIKRVDTALYQAKKEGRNRVVVGGVG
ncbi:MAG: diguanylate cyclase [Magnetococcales bacterium]|nr:diguanylate cyclase [Magnetococcales bacterium]